MAVKDVFSKLPCFRLAVLSFAALAAARALGHWGLNDFANSADEFAYLFQAHTFARGEPSVAAHSLQEYLSPFFILTREGRTFSLFPPGWPALLTIGVWVGAPWWVNPCLAALSVPAAYHLARCWLDPGGAWRAAWLMALSPFFLFNAASLFSHAAAMTALAWMLVFLMAGMERGGWFRAALAGVCFGYAFTVREYTAVLIAAPPLGLALLRAPRRVAFATAFCTGAAPFALAYAAYNHALTGGWLMPARFLSPSERLGFGERVIQVFDYKETLYFGPLDGLANTARNLGRLFLWTPPGLPLLAAWGVWRLRANAMALALAASCVLLFTGYALYPSDGGNQYGPRFYFEALPFLAIFASAGIADLYNRMNIASKSLQRGIAAAMIVLTFALAGYWCVQRHHQIVRRETLFRLVESRHLQDALVFVSSPSGDMTQGDLIRNLPGFENADVVYAWNMGERNAEIARAFPDRTPFLYGIDPRNGAPYLQRMNSRLGE
ncbi:MAG: hypothetical protein GC154_16285 [bacterium]|nr:hypothetical protein [bacterium]